MRDKRKPSKHYYRIIGYKDGSGWKDGIVIKSYTEEEAENLVKCGGLILERIDKSKEEI